MVIAKVIVAAFVVIVAGIALPAGAADRVVLGELFTATW